MFSRCGTHWLWTTKLKVLAGTVGDALCPHCSILLVGFTQLTPYIVRVERANWKGSNRCVESCHQSFHVVDHSKMWNRHARQHSTSLTLKPVKCAIALLTPAACPVGPSMNFSSFSLGQWGDSEPIFYLRWTTYRFHMYFWSLPRNWQPWSFWGWCCWHRENRVRLLAQSFLLVLSARSPKCKCFERVGPSL